MTYRPLVFLLLIYQIGLLQTIEDDKTAQADSAYSLGPRWEFSGELYFYYLSKDDFYLMPVIAADRGRLHLEARYNYEDFRSFSFFTGRIFTAREKAQLEVIPLLGGVVGKKSGIVPGLEVDFQWSNFELYSEAEYLFDLQEKDSDYFYNWAEIRYYPGQWLVGITSQQTREVKGDWLVDNGLVGGINFFNYSGLIYLFNPGGENMFTIFTFAFIF